MGATKTNYITELNYLHNVVSMTCNTMGSKIVTNK